MVAGGWNDGGWVYLGGDEGAGGVLNGLVIRKVKELFGFDTPKLMLRLSAYMYCIIHCNWI
jgi:hypothetical protein